MIGYGLPARMKMFGNGVWCHRLRGQQNQYGPPGRVSDGLKNISSCFHQTLFMQSLDCKYMCNYLIAQIYFQLFFAGAKGREVYCR
jgi:hypothetical protein